jgi:hypothetical protein
MNMEKDFTHTLKLLQTLREAGLKPSTIDSIVINSQLNDPDKKTISILNGHPTSKIGIEGHILGTYFPYKAVSGDYRQEFNPSYLMSYTPQKGNISHN